MAAGIANWSFRKVLGWFLLAHALAHALLATEPRLDVAGAGAGTIFTSHSWALDALGVGPQAIRVAGALLWAGAVLGFGLAGLGLLNVEHLAKAWRWLAIGAGILSLALIGLFWLPRLGPGAVIDAGLLAALTAGWGKIEKLII